MGVRLGAFFRFNLMNKSNTTEVPPRQSVKWLQRYCSWGQLTLRQKFRFAAYIIGFVGSALMAHWVHQRYVVTAEQSSLTSMAQKHAENTATNIAEYVKQTHQQLAFFTKKTALHDAVKSGNRSAEALLKNQVEAYIPNTTTVHFFTKDQIKLNPQIFPPIGFSEIDQIKRTFTRAPVRPEAGKVEGQWYVSFSAPIPYDESQPVVGVLFVTLTFHEFEERVLNHNRGLGKVSLKQIFEDTRGQEILSYGNGISTIKAESVVPNSYWEVTFSPSNQLKVDVDTTLIYVVVAILAVALIFLLQFLAIFLARLVSQQLNLSYGADTGEPVENRYDDTKPDDHSSPIYQSSDILDIELDQQDEALLGLEEEDLPEEAAGPEEDAEEALDEEVEGVPANIFRAYDIRGLAKTEISNELARSIGLAIGSEAQVHHENTLIVARDARMSSPELMEWLIRGILSSGCNVINIGTVPTPLLYFATEVSDDCRSGVMVTASHNPAEYNGFKVVIEGKCRSGDDIRAIRRRIIKGDLYEGEGREEHRDFTDQYVETIFSDVALARDLSIVVDAGNGVTGLIAPRLFEELGCDVTTLYCDLDGRFPNHDPDPSVPENLSHLIAKVKETDADLGVAFDGDGDRIAIVTPAGKIIWPDQLLMLFSKDILSRNPGADVIFDVKSTRQLNKMISRMGGRPIMWKTGHSHMKEKMVETGALLGGEYSGHIFIKDRWFGFDDGMYAAARLFEILSFQDDDLDTVFEEFPIPLSTPEIRVAVEDTKKFEIIEQLSQSGDFSKANLITLDGLRAEFKQGWGLVRASNTSPHLTLRFEAIDKVFLHKLKALFVRELRKIDPSIRVEWSDKDER